MSEVEFSITYQGEQVSRGSDGELRSVCYESPPAGGGWLRVSDLPDDRTLWCRPKQEEAARSDSEAEPLDGDLHMGFLGDILAELRLIKEDVRWLRDREENREKAPKGGKTAKAARARDRGGKAKRGGSGGG